MKASIALVLNGMVLGLAVQAGFVQAQPLELVTLSDKGGLLPPEDKMVKEEPAKTASAKPSNGVKKSPVAASSEKTTGGVTSAANHRTTYVVKSGDTLDKVIAQNFADSIVKPEVLKKELMAMNPGAFSKGNPKMLLSGSTLKLPVPEQLLAKSSNQMGTTWSGEKANLMLSGYTAYPPVYVNAENSEKRRHWVQYP